MSYRLSRRADTQLDSAVRKREDYAGIFSAEKLSDAFDRVFDMLGKFPEAGSVRTDLTRLPLRLFPCDVYWVVHKPRRPHDVDIVAIIDMRDQPPDNALGRRGYQRIVMERPSVDTLTF
jgi:plasmid stabilization system protein ParE